MQSGNSSKPSSRYKSVNGPGIKTATASQSANVRDRRTLRMLGLRHLTPGVPTVNYPRAVKRRTTQGVCAEGDTDAAAASSLLIYDRRCVERVSAIQDYLGKQNRSRSSNNSSVTVATTTAPGFTRAKLGRQTSFDYRDKKKTLEFLRSRVALIPLPPIDAAWVASILRRIPCRNDPKSAELQELLTEVSDLFRNVLSAHTGSSVALSVL